MPDNHSDKQFCRQIEIAVQRLESLSALPAVANAFLSQLADFRLSPASLTELIETEPALAARIMSLYCRDNGAAADNEKNCCIGKAVEQLPLQSIREAVLSIQMYCPEPGQEQRLTFRKNLIKHSIAVACCARGIAETALSEIEPEFAYLAGLLHDIGKFALDEILPRSFIRIISQAEEQAACSFEIEQKNLGLDHTIIGKKLADKWQLPEKTGLAAWLHHNDASFLSGTLPNAKIIPLVKLADIIARQLGIGQSGSYDQPTIPDDLLQSLEINEAHLEQIYQTLPNEVLEKCSILDQQPNSIHKDYNSRLRDVAVQIAQENSQLAAQNRKFQLGSASLSFCTELLSKVHSSAEPIEVARTIAVCMQKFYQTGPLCLLLMPSDNYQMNQPAVVVDQSRSKVVFLQPPTQSDGEPASKASLPKSIQQEFVVSEAAGEMSWLFDQVDVDFEPGKTKMLPLVFEGKSVGVLLFQPRQPVKNEQLKEAIEPVAGMAAALLSFAARSYRQQYFAERLSLAKESGSHTIHVPPHPPGVKTQEQPQQEQVISKCDQGLEPLAEMAAGAAHELNNPLSVISGRAQMLSQQEQDDKKRQILEQISDNAKEISGIIGELMSFAKPAYPQFAFVTVRYLIDKAVELAKESTKTMNINVEKSVFNNLPDVTVDPGQITTALAGVIVNANESYLTKSGPINVIAQPCDNGNRVEIIISDLGCGMDSNTVQKATFPFFSAKPAGRKRGMGLAIANRLIQLNNGSLSIKSVPAEGTTVTVVLPAGRRERL